MTLIEILLVAFLPASLVIGAPGNEQFALKVERLLTVRSQPGDLQIDASGVTFNSSDGKTSITIPMKDLREANVADPRRLKFETYEVQKWKPIERRAYIFRGQSDAPVEALARFLSERVHRPIVGHYPEGSHFRISAYHRRTLNGTNGILESGEASIRYVSDKPADSRTWLYRDIETIGRPDAFRFRVTTNRETYVLELKEDLLEAAYEFAWSKIYHLEGSSK